MQWVLFFFSKLLTLEFLRLVIIWTSEGRLPIIWLLINKLSVFVQKTYKSLFCSKLYISSALELIFCNTKTEYEEIYLYLLNLIDGFKKVCTLLNWINVLNDLM